ncbi:MAG: RES family NAD+ phosphorylase [Planctomycetes bacterium]|nr:RES family NAD+ phosphorylase [Planctomycetota bacterium]
MGKNILEKQPHWNDFRSFGQKKKQEERYFHDEQTQRFFTTLLTTARDRIKSIRKGQLFWRAQLGCGDDPLYDNGQIVDYNAVPFTTERMKPLAGKIGEGRINPKGIPCLYLATDEKTAISEIRPWVGSYVTIVQFKTLKNLKVIDCSLSKINPMAMTVADLDKLWKFKPPTPEEAIKTIWEWIDLAFCRPVENNDKITDYIPTQIIAELFKTNGVDGVKYKSLFNHGKNLALFDINSAKQIEEGKVFQITEVDIDFKQKWPIQFKKRGKYE